MNLTHISWIAFIAVLGAILWLSSLIIWTQPKKTWYERTPPFANSFERVIISDTKGGYNEIGFRSDGVVVWREYKEKK